MGIVHTQSSEGCCGMSGTRICEILIHAVVSATSCISSFLLTLSAVEAYTIEKTPRTRQKRVKDIQQMLELQSKRVADRKPLKNKKERKQQ